MRSKRIAGSPTQKRNEQGWLLLECLRRSGTEDVPGVRDRDPVDDSVHGERERADEADAREKAPAVQAEREWHEREQEQAVTRREQQGGAKERPREERKRADAREREAVRRDPEHYDPYRK